ncbi:MAG: electron transfer flavoprotein subunit beta/FixA family protein [Chloroflexi bacterium]|nr:electron transfer flavoprotein subunit beta/FixA family protein [Chloroflexota bacterium]
MDVRTGALKRQDVPGIINREDMCALEEAIRLRDSHGGTVTAISMGPPQAERSLREALAMGADRAVWLCDRAFAGSDTLATSYVLAQAVRKLGNFDLILCGKQTSDGNTAQVGPELAERLGLPQVTSVRSLEIRQDQLGAERSLESGVQWVETMLPALVTVTRQINTPRQVPVEAILTACREREVVVWAASDLGVEAEQVGFLGSPTKMVSSRPGGVKRREGEIIGGTPRDAVRVLLERLRQRQLIRETGHDAGR